ncbi:MAG: tRNA lysidine(34) synthetase TilS [Bacteroidales bacterium]|nr:tRNA lysidine(34) synthetase TilS [Bacteroidales bacterium]MCM1147258.1 tRNA lysidine(34) synthetase TilS [Bacteroidales bacterium]MCM1206309.1 tRNA lysidine(34) synthetase TilS [Bacillota bacterium]MCM1510486.1 tRNA lysidine(34) synthetase TilS [Clostridium sp.]
MFHIIEKFIRTNDLLSKDGLHLVALSGGADSVALLLILKELGYRIEAIHCNFHLRGEESDRDESFCNELCKSTGTKLHIVHFNTKAFAKLHGISIEMAARDLRYSYFRTLKKDINADSICVAHHKDDLAETVLMNLIRGTGLLGMTGIRPKNGDIIRPLLCVTRKDIEGYMTSKGQHFVTDSTNLVDDVTRNNIRLNIMPLLKAINPSITDAITNTARHINDTLPLIKESTARWISKCTVNTDGILEIDISKLLDSPSPSHILYSILNKKGIPSQLITEISKHLNSQTGTVWSYNEITAVINRGKLIIANKQNAFQEITIPIPGKYKLRNGKHLHIETLDRTKDFVIDKNAFVAQMDSQTVTFPLTLREVKNGDRFSPFGMNGTKLVSDFLTDRKVCLLKKRSQLCLTDAKGEIIWLIGQRISNNNKISNDTIKIISARYF